MSTALTRPPAQVDALGQTHRTDRWWVGPLLTALGLGAFGVYATLRAFYPTLVDPVGYFQYGHGAVQPYVPPNNDTTHSYLLSPLFSPLLVWPSLPAWISPAIFILWAPGGFRLTCYYYRKAYYRAYLADPPGCAVGEGRKAYRGETRLFLFQNLHRYFLYVAIVFLVLLFVDVVHAAMWPSGQGGLRFGVSVGTLVLLLNVGLLGAYTFSCHSFRHLIGGNVNCFSCARFGAGRYQAWKRVSLMNKFHMQFAWLSLFWVGFTDFYVWMVASGRWADFRFF
ncbi:MAG: hypothetical protein KF752_13820 [Pirellulaceae bacterium]|nr:hypothetical protein [Pirellulaceae bacterium]